MHGEGARFEQRHGFAGRQRAAGVAFAHEQMFLGVRLAFIGDGERVDPGEGLRYGLHLNQIEREAGLLVNETGAEGLAGVVQIDGGGAEAVGSGLSVTSLTNAAGSFEADCAVRAKRDTSVRTSGVFKIGNFIVKRF